MSFHYLWIPKESRSWPPHHKRKKRKKKNTKKQKTKIQDYKELHYKIYAESNRKVEKANLVSTYAEFEMPLGDPSYDI